MRAISSASYVAQAPSKAAEPVASEREPGREESAPDDSESSANGNLNSFEAPPSESINVWPDEAAEVAFFGATSEAETPLARPEVETSEQRPLPAPPLPKLEELVNRIPPESRELLDELFRAKFTVVRRVKASDLKTS